VEAVEYQPELQLVGVVEEVVDIPEKYIPHRLRPHMMWWLVQLEHLQCLLAVLLLMETFQPLEEAEDLHLVVEVVALGLGVTLILMVEMEELDFLCSMILLEGVVVEPVAQVEMVEMEEMALQGWEELVVRALHPEEEVVEVVEHG
jgi:hypothetical protein